MNYSLIENKANEVLVNQNINDANSIEIDKIIRSFGINISCANIEGNISGLFVIKDDKHYIRVNKNENKQRQRFTKAHELGHFLLHKNIPLFIDRNERIMYRDSNSSTGEMLREREANHFAACLLMPRKFIETEINNIPDDENNVLKYLSNKFKISDQAMSFRLANLGYDLI